MVNVYSAITGLINRIAQGCKQRVKLTLGQLSGLTAIRIKGLESKPIWLYLSNDATVGDIERKICLQKSVHPGGVDLFRNEHRLDGSATIADLKSTGLLTFDARFNQSISGEVSEFGFTWHGLRFDPFEAQKVSEYIRKSATWFLEQDEIDSKSRRKRINSLLERMALKDSQVIAMTFNNKYSLLFLNWVASLREHGIDVINRCIVFPMDDESAKVVERQGFYFCYEPESEIIKLTGSAEVYGDKEFARHMFYQNAVIRDLLECGVNLLFQDVDVVWLKDPLPLLLENPDHVQFMFDGRNPRHGPLYANTGFMYFRNEPVTRDFWEIIYRRAEQVFVYRSQQEPLNKVLGVINQRGFNVRILAEKDFANGHLINIDIEKSRLPEDPYVIHCSWTGRLDEKYAKYANYGIWYLEDAQMI